MPEHSFEKCGAGLHGDPNWIREAVVALILSPIRLHGPLLLVVWNKRYGGWSMPGGMREHGETIDEALARELFDGTGNRLASARLVFRGPRGVAALSEERPGRPSIVNLFLVETTGMVDGFVPEEGCPVRWLPVSQFLRESPFAEFYGRILPDIVSEQAP